VAALLAAGADISAKDKQGHTPLAVAAAEGYPGVVQVLLKHVLQQYKAEQQSPLPQQQQQQQQHDQYMQMLQQAGAMSLSKGKDTWQVFLPLVAEALGEEGVRSLWAGVQQQLQPPCEEAAGQVCGSVDPWVPPHMLWESVQCWVDAWGDLAAQRSDITGRLEQLVVGAQHQQQQVEEGGSAGAGRRSKRPRLVRELAMLREDAAAAASSSAGQRQAAAIRRATSDSWRSYHSTSTSSSRRASRARVKHLNAERAAVAQVEAAADRGDEPGVYTALGQLENRAAGLSQAACAAAKVGNWGLCMALLRELVMLDEAEWVQSEALTCGGYPRALRGVVRDLRVDLARALEGCDVLLADWLALRQQQVRELREAVVAAAEAATAAGV
jgi:hypothetical protein